jgi:hypothetical protein
MEVGMSENPKVKAACDAFRHAPHRHRFVTVGVMFVGWYVLEYVIHLPVAAKGVELFGLVPFADKVVGMVFTAE